MHMHRDRVVPPLQYLELHPERYWDEEGEYFLCHAHGRHPTLSNERLRVHGIARGVDGREKARAEAHAAWERTYRRLRGDA